MTEIEKQIGAIANIKKGLNLTIEFTADKETIKELMPKVNYVANLKPGFKVEYLPIENYFLPDEDYQKHKLFYFCHAKMIDLISFVQSGEKVVPPVLEQKTRFVDWQKQDVVDTRFIDGSHRIRLAHELGYKEIPFIIKTSEEFVFTIAKNDFSIAGGQLTVADPAGQKLNFSLSDNYVDIDYETEMITISNK